MAVVVRWPREPHAVVGGRKARRGRRMWVSGRCIVGLLVVVLWVVNVETNGYYQRRAGGSWYTGSHLENTTGRSLVAACCCHIDCWRVVQPALPGHVMFVG